MRQEVPIVGGFGKDADLHLSAEDTLNWLPVRSESPGSRSQFMLRQPPGLRPLTEIGTGPIRGVHTVEGRLYAVSGTQLFEVTSSYVGIPRGTIPGVGRVSMAHNQRGTGNELAVDNGAARYVLNTATLAFQKVTDAGFPGSFIAFYVDQYLGYVEPQGRYWGHSDLADALSYNTLDQYEAEGDPDRIVSAYVSHREVLIFGKETTEPFVNTGGSTGTFERASNTVIENGCAARFGVAGMDNSVFWPDDKRIIRRLDGYSAIRISTAAEEAMLAACTDSEIKRAYAFTWEDRGHKVYYLTVPGKFTLGYDLLSGQFHRRSSPGMNTWRINSLTYWNGLWIGGDMQSGALYSLDWDYFYDGQEELVRERVTGALSKENSRLLVSEIELLFGTGGPSSAADAFVPQPDGPSISGSAPNGVVGQPYTHTYTTSGGTAPLVVTLAPGSDPLPPGLTLSTAGVLSGTPTTLGSSSFVVRVTDDEGLYDDLADTAEMLNVGPWFFGPVAINGALGGSEAYYKTTSDPTDWSAAPVALPVALGGLSRISVANRAVFFMDVGSGLMTVSTDAGATWDTCTGVTIDATLDVFWNGNFYYHNTTRSADGITWGAIPSLPANTKVRLARQSDGAVVGWQTSTGYQVTVNDGTSWTLRTGYGTDAPDTAATDGSRITFNISSTQGRYTDDLFATATAVPVVNNQYSSYWNDATYGFKTDLAGARLHDLTDGTTQGGFLVALGVSSRSDANVAGAIGGWIVGNQTAGTPPSNAIEYAADAVTFSTVATLYGNGKNIAVIKDTP